MQPSVSTADPAVLAIAAASAVPTDESREDALGLLQVLLNKVSRLDTDGFFQEPVTEAVAPGYFEIIQRPMCFKSMRAKLQAREYRTWRSFVEDFELICSNAMTYNQKRSLINKKALVMLRQGKKILAESELAGRRAIGLLHPGGPPAAALEEQQELLLRAGSGGAVVGGLLGRSTSLLSEERHATGAGPSGPGAAGGQLSYAVDTSMDADDLLFGCVSSDDEAYSSFSDTDMSDDDRPLDAQRLQQQQPAARVACVATGQAPFAGTAEAAAAPGSSCAKQHRSAEWKAETRSLERRCRWLELRLRELHDRAEDCKRKYLHLASSGSGSQPAAATVAPKHRLPRATPPEFASLQQHPFVAAHTQLGKRKRTAEAAGLEEPATGDQCFAARVYAALELVDRQVSAVRKYLQAAPQAGQQAGGGAAGAAGGQPKLHRGAGGRGGGRGAAGAPGSGRGLQRSVSGRGGRGVRPLERVRSAAPQRTDSLSGKRRRTEYDLTDMVAPVKILAPKFVDKVQVAPIATPAFRPLTADELARRQAAVASLGLVQGGGGTQFPVAVADLVSGEGSSSEDTSDEAYLQRHQQRELEERELFAVYAGAAANKKTNKPQSKTKPRGPAGKPSKGGFQAPADSCAQPGPSSLVTDDVSSGGRDSHRAQPPAPAAAAEGGSAAAPLKAEGGRAGGRSACRHAPPAAMHPPATVRCKGRGAEWRVWGLYDHPQSGAG